MLLADLQVSAVDLSSRTLQTVDGSKLYADLHGFKSSSILTGDAYRPDLLLSCLNGCLYVVELTTGYETNLKNNVTRKKDKYSELLRQLYKNFNQVKFINLSISPLGNPSTNGNPSTHVGSCFSRDRLHIYLPTDSYTI